MGQQIEPARRSDFSQTFFEEKKSKQWHSILQEREEAEIVDSKYSGKCFSTELGQFVVNLNRLYRVVMYRNVGVTKQNIATKIQEL